MPRDGLARPAGPLFLLAAPAAPNQSPSGSPRRRPMSWLLRSQIVLGLLVAFTTGLVVVHLRQQALTAARHESQSLALTLADQAERAFEAVDLVQTTFMEMAQADHIQTPDEFRRRMSTPEVNQQMIAHGSALPQLSTLGLVDTDGLIVNFNKPWPLPTVRILDRDYFQALTIHPGLARIISDPILNRRDQTWTVVVAHSVNNADGRLVAVSFAGVGMSYFEKLYQAVTKNENTAISLYRNDGMLLARYPHIGQTIGTSFAHGDVRKNLEAIGPDTDVTAQIGPADDVERLTTGHTLANYPMLVTVSTNVSAVLAPWRRQTAVIIGVAVILELGVVGVGLLMERQLRDQTLLARARAAMAEADNARRAAEAELALGQERERADRQLRVQAVRFSAALSNMSEALCLFDAADRLVMGNDRLAAILGLPTGTITPGMSIQDMGALLAEAPGVPLRDPMRLHGLIIAARAAGNRDSRILDTDDGGRIAVNFAPMDNDGWLVTLEDITQQRRSEARIDHMAHHDALTGLANRILFHDRLDQSMALCQRGEICAVLYLDLDHFKAVNDTLGHPAGDALLRDVTQRLKLVVRESDTIARLGGDEFAIIQAISRPADSTLLAKRVIETLAAPYDINGNQVIIGVSVGIAIAPDDGQDTDEIIKNADLALYRSKADGRGRYQFFEPGMDTRMQARRRLDLDLRKALVEGQFEVFYQPLITIATRSVSGFEALVRWQHPERGMISPADFIPLAEETGLIIPLGKWVLRQACTDAAAWPADIRVAVNLSPVQFGSYTLVDDVAAALADSGLAANRLELEITETAILSDTDAVLGILHQLRDLGLKIALDDFGTGYSSLSYLQRFPFDKIKIDRSFVARLGQGSGDDTIVAAVADLCNRLGMVTIGEGVETPAQLDRLIALNCVEAQGYLFSQPRPVAEVAAILMKLKPQQLTGIEL